jgi:hypothetical protein
MNVRCMSLHRDGCTQAQRLPTREQDAWWSGREIRQMVWMANVEDATIVRQATIEKVLKSMIVVICAQSRFRVSRCGGVGQMRAMSFYWLRSCSDPSQSFLPALSGNRSGTLPYSETLLLLFLSLYHSF